MFIVVDASIWVARLVPEDVFHNATKDWMMEQMEKGNEFVSPSLLLAEVGGAITRKTGEPTLGLKAIQQLEGLPAMRLVEMDDDLARESAKQAAELGLRGADSTYVATAARLNLPMITLDADQKTRASRRITVLDIPTQKTRPG